MSTNVAVFGKLKEVNQRLTCSTFTGAAPAPLQTETFDFGPPARPVARAQSFAPRPKPAPVQYAQPAPFEDDFQAAPAPRYDQFDNSAS